jgi:transcriptional regulator with XRE-family HTH domain
MRLHKEGRKRLAKLLIIQEVRHRELATAIGWKSHGMISQLISGTRTGVEPDKALAIAKYLGVEVSDLFLTEMPSIAPGVTRRDRPKAGVA